MHSNSGQTIVVVLDPEYGDRIADVKSLGPLWVVGTPCNERAWRKFGPFAPNSALFSVADCDARLENLVASLPDLMDHFGTDSLREMPIRRCNVVGISASDEVKGRLGEMGVEVIQADVNSFICMLPNET